MVVVNIMNDEKGDKRRNHQKLLSFMSILDKLPNGVPVNVFGGGMNYPNAKHIEKGDFHERSTLIKLLRYTRDNYSPDDLMIILEADVMICVDFVRYIMEMEESCPYPESVRSGYTALDSSVLAFEYAVLSRSRFWFSVPVSDWWGTPCTWMHVSQWNDYFDFLVKYDNNIFRLDTALKDWMTSRGVEFLSILIPNPALHIGATSAIFEGGDLSGEGGHHMGRRQSVSYLEDPYAI